jgi:hypothetical protein
MDYRLGSDAGSAAFRCRGCTRISVGQSLRSLRPCPLHRLYIDRLPELLVPYFAPETEKRAGRRRDLPRGFQGVAVPPGSPRQKPLWRCSIRIGGRSGSAHRLAIGTN